MSNDINKPDITIRLNFVLDTTEIDFIQHIEKSIDCALSPIGFTRVTSTKSGDYVEINYFQYGKALK